MNRLFVASLLAALASCNSTYTPSASHSPHVDVLYGSRDFDDRQDWEETDQQEALGLQLHLCGKGGFGPELGFVLSHDSSSDPMYENRSVYDTTSNVRELYVGVRQNFMVTDWLQLFAGGGATVVQVETELDLTYATESPSEKDSAVAPYGQLGANIFITPSLAVGVLYRRNFLGEDADIFINHPEADGDLLLFTVGYSF
jgi:opacity protein-like surface antigen